MKYGLWLHIPRLTVWKHVGAVLGGVTLSKTSGGIPGALADAMVRFPEEAEAYKAEMDTRRAIAGIRWVNGW